MTQAQFEKYLQDKADKIVQISSTEVGQDNYILVVLTKKGCICEYSALQGLWFIVLEF